MKLGEYLRRKYDIPESEIAGAIAAQWSCPTFPAAEISPNWSGILPLRLVEFTESCRSGCWRPAGSCMWAARSAFLTTYCMPWRRMLELRTEPCIISDSAFASQLRQHGNDTADNDIVVESLTSPAEVAHMTRSYAQQLQADEVRYVLLWKLRLASRARTATPSESALSSLGFGGTAQSLGFPSGCGA